MCVYIYIHICMYMYVYVCTYIYIYMAQRLVVPSPPEIVIVPICIRKLYIYIYVSYIYICRIIQVYIRRPRPTQGGARQGIRHFPPTIWKLATATATATAAAAVLFCAMVFSRPGPTFLQQPAAGAAGRQQQSSQQSRSR